MTNPYLSAVDALETPAERDNKYLAVIDGAQARDDSVLRSSIHTALRSNPDQYAKARALSAETGLPADMVERNMDVVDRRVTTNKYAELLADSPGLAERMRDPEFAKVAHDDLDNLSVFERVKAGSQSVFDLATGFPWAVAGAVSRGLDKFNTGQQLFSALMSKYVGVPMDDVPAYVPRGTTTKILNDWSSAIYARSNKNMQAAQAGLDPVTQGIISGAHSVALNLPYQVLAVATRNPQLALIPMSLTTAGEAYQTAIDKGVSHEQALAYAGGQGLVEYATEGMPLTRFLDDLKAGSGFLKTMGTNLVLENYGEQWATHLQDLNQWATLNPEKTLGDYLRERPNAALQTLIATTFATLLQGSASYGVGRLVESQYESQTKAMTAERTKSITEQLMSAAEASKLRQRDVGAFEEAVDAATKDGPITEVLINAEKFGELYQDAAPEMLAAVGVSEEQFSEALATQGDIAIAIPKFASTLAVDPRAKPLVDHIKFAHDDMTPAEAKKILSEQQEEMTREGERILTELGADEEFRASAQRVQDQVFAQLEATKRFRPEVNRTYATLTRTFIAVQAKRMGLTPEAFVAAHPINISSVSGLPEMSLEQDQSEVIPQAIGAKKIVEVGRGIGMTMSLQVSEDGTRGAVFAHSFTRKTRNSAKATQNHDLMYAGPIADARAYWEKTKTNYKFDTSLDQRGATQQFIVGDQGEQAVVQMVEFDGKVGFKVEIDGKELGTFDDIPTAAREAQKVIGGKGIFYQTPSDQAAFDAWFKESKAVNDKGEPVIVYHGGGQDIQSFTEEGAEASPVSGGAQAFFFSDAPENASGYAEDKGTTRFEIVTRAGRLIEGGFESREEAEEFAESEVGVRYRIREVHQAPTVYPVYLSLQNPLIIDAKGANWSRIPLPKAVQKQLGIEGEKATWSNRLIAQAKRAGFDGVIIRNVIDTTGSYEKPQTTYAVFDGTSVKSIFNSGTFDPNDPNILNQAAATTIVTGPSLFTNALAPLNLTEAELASTAIEWMTGFNGDFTFVPPEIGGVAEVVEFLHERRLASGLPTLNIENPADRTQLARLMAAEALAAIQSAGKALHWYDQTIRETIAQLSIKYPELANDPRARTAFFMAMAISSQGLDVEANMSFAMRQYDAYRKTVDANGVGKFPEEGMGANGGAQAINFELANELLAEYGPDKLAQFLATPFTVKQLQEAGFEIGGELVDEVVLGSAVFGPKIGFGFYSNLTGNFDPVTMDMWFMRTIGRLSGTLPAFKREKFDKQISRFRDSLRERGKRTAGIYASQFDRDLVNRAKTDEGAAIELARLVSKAHEKDFKDNRALFDKGERQKTELVYAADTILTSLDTPKDAPSSGGERRNLRDVVRQATSLVSGAIGKPVPPAAFQALIWYPEQELYSALGVKLRVTSQDYSGAARKFLIKDGIDEKQIDAAIAQSGPGGAQPLAAGAVQGGATATGQRAGAAVPFTPGERTQFLLERNQRLLRERQARAARVIFEVAPDPTDAALTARWRALSTTQREEISDRVARKVVPKVLKAVKAKGQMLPQVGSYLEDTNPSFAIRLEKGDPSTVTNTIGFVLSQNEMMAIAAESFAGAFQSSALRIDIGEQSAADIDRIYHVLHQIEVDGRRVINGQSTSGGIMTVLLGEKDDAKAIADLVDSALGGAYEVTTHEVFAAFPGKQDYDYARAESDPPGDEGVARQRARDARAEATALIRAELDAAEQAAQRQEGELNQSPVWRSALADAISALPIEEASGEKWIATLIRPKETGRKALRDAKNKPTGEVQEYEIPRASLLPGVKLEEIDWYGLEDWLKGQKSVTRQELLDYLKSHQIEVTEVLKGSSNENASLDEWANRIYGTNYENLAPGQMSRIQREAFGNENGPTKFSQWQLPGGENYRELLLTLPVSTETSQGWQDYRDELIARGMSQVDADEVRRWGVGAPAESVNQTAIQKARDMMGDAWMARYQAVLSDKTRRPVSDAFRGPHYDEPNIISIIRFNDRTDADGKRVLHIEEMQDDLDNAMRAAKKAGDMVEYERLKGLLPFRGTSHELALKRMIRWAAENGYDRVTWNMGQVVADRYDLSKHFKSVDWEVVAPGRVSIGGQLKQESDRYASAGIHDADKLGQVLGKGLAQQVNEAMARGETQGHFANADLKIGGEGKIEQYDVIMPSIANKLGKKFGAKVGRTNIRIAKGMEVRGDGDRGYYVYKSGGAQPVSGPFWQESSARSWIENRGQLEAQPVHSLDITPQMRESVMQGQPLFQQNRGAFNPATRTITLLQNADLSTFLHELGHWQLETMVELALQPNAPAQIVKDVQTLLDWFGVKDIATWRSMTLEQQREFHEKFARGFEAYLFKGESPNAELRGIFSRFRAWLLGVYKHIKALNVTLTPEVEQVFGRMLASEEEIAAAEATRGFRAIFQSQEESGMSEEEWLRYQQTGAQATTDAQEELERKSLKDMQWLANAKNRELKKLQAQHDKVREAVKAEVEAEVEREPVYAALAFLKRGILPERLTGRREDIAQMAGMEGYKLSLPVLKQMYGEGPAAPWRYLSFGPNGLAAEDGMHPDMAAELLGYDSGDALVKALLEAPPMAEVVDARTDQRMLEEHGELVDPKAVERAAEAAIHNVARAKFVAAELAALEQAMSPKTPAGKDKRGRPRSVNLIVQAAKQYAEQKVAAMKIRDVRKSGRYLTAEGKAAREAEKAHRKGDLAAAVMAKRSQMLSGALYKASEKAAEEVDKTVEYLKKFLRAGTRENIDQDYLDQIDALLESVELKTVSLRELDRRENLRDWIAKQQDMGIEPTLDPDVVDRLAKTNFADMTVEQVRVLRETIKQIEHLGRLKQKLLTAKDKREFDAIVAEMVQSIKDNSGGKTVKNMTGTTKLDRAVRLFKGFLASHRKLASLARQMDGSKDGGKLWEYFIRAMNEAGDHEATMREQATVKLAALIQPLMKGPKMGGKGEYIRELLGSGLGPSLNREQRIAVALNVGNAGNLQRLMSGYALNRNQLDAILNRLTKEDWDFVQSIWDLFDSYRPEIAEKEKRVMGSEPDWVEPTPVQTRFGEYRGGYYPVKYDPLASQRAEEHADAEDARLQMRAAYTSATTRRSFVKPRANEVMNRPLLLTFGGIYQGLNEVIHDLAWHEWVIDANRLMKAPALNKAIRDTYGAEIVQQFKRGIEDIARGDVPAQQDLERVLNHLRTGSTVVGLGWNVMTSLLQPLGLTQSMVRIGPKWVAKGIGDFVSRPLESLKEVYSKSEFMRVRAKTMQREINEIQNTIGGDKSKARSAVEASFFMLIQKVQLGADVPTWLGAYEKAIAEGNDESRSVALADQAVIDSQGGGQIKDLALVQRGGPIQKLFTNFYSYFNLTYNLAAESARRTDFRKPKDVGALAVDYLLLMVLPSVLGTLLRAAVSPDDDDEEELARKLIGDQISYLFGLMVGLREAAGFAQYATGTKVFPTTYSGPAGARFFSELEKFGKQVGQGELDAALFRSGANVAGILLHWPTGQVVRTVEGAAALIEGKTEDPRVLLTGYR